MKGRIPLVLIAAASVLLALIARPDSLGVRLNRAAVEYTAALESGRGEDALGMMTGETAEGFSASFLSRLSGVPAPPSFVYDGTDSRGIRMAGRTTDSGTRVVWFTRSAPLKVVHDTALDNLMGAAVMLCRENAAADPGGTCPVSGAQYEYDPASGTVVCPQGHLGSGITVVSDACVLRRDSVAAEVRAFIAAGYGMPATIEDIYTVSSGEFGRRGGYRCPDNGYKYYELRDGAVYCPFHEEATPVTVAE